MEPHSYWDLFYFITLFISSIFFSMSETAFVSLTESELLKLKKSEKDKDKSIFKLLSDSTDRLLITILLGNNLANVGIATLAAIFTSNMIKGTEYESYGMLINVGIVGSMILLFGELLPKIFAIRNSLKFVRRFYGLAFFFFMIFTPITYLIHMFVKVFTDRLSEFKGLSALTQHDIKSLMEVGGEEGVLEEDEKNMITSIFEFSETTAKEIMVPRVDMSTISDTIALEELLEFIKITSYSRIPVYHDNIDDIIGILYIKDLLSIIDKNNERFELKNFLRDVTFIPETKDIGNLLKMFQKEKIHIAIVVDEYGGTSGMITLEDIIEEIVGEIQDEFDDEEKLFKKINENCYEFDAKTDIEDVNETLGINLPDDEDYESLGGFIYYIFEEVPEIGAKKRYENLNFTILSVDKQRIGWVKIDILEKDS